MIEQFYNFHSIAFGVLQLLSIIVVGFVLFKFELLTKSANKSLNNLLLWVLLPALILSKITNQFHPADSPHWWFLPFASVIISLIGIGIGMLILKTRSISATRREFLLSIGFQNCVYLPMTLVAFVCAGDVCNTLLVSIFLFSIGFNVAVWSFSIPFLSKGDAKKVDLFTILNPPALSTILAIVSVFLFGNQWMPSLLNKPLELLGNAAFPFALILLGATLSAYRGYHLKEFGLSSWCLAAKLILLPLVVLIIIKLLPVSQLNGFVIFLEATMPSAVSLIIIGEHVGADNQFISGIILYSHIIAVLSIPAWLTVYNLIG